MARPPKADWAVTRRCKVERCAKAATTRLWVPAQSQRARICQEMANYVDVPECHCIRFFFSSTNAARFTSLHSSPESVSGTFAAWNS